MLQQNSLGVVKNLKTNFYLFIIYLNNYLFGIEIEKREVALLYKNDHPGLKNGWPGYVYLLQAFVINEY